MKSILIALTSPLMMVFALSGLQTIEWHTMNNSPVPAFAYILILIVAIWCFCASRCRKEDFESARITWERWIESIFK